MKNLIIFASGTGSNYQAIRQAIARGRINAHITHVICDRADAAVIAKAELDAIPCFVFDPKAYPNKAAYEKDILAICRSDQADYLVLAGYMRLIGATLLAAYPGKILNLHPSLLPKYKGKHALDQALDHNDLLLGATIHYVDQSLDGGPIIDQVEFSRTPDESKAIIEDRLHQYEHQLYIRVLQKLCGGEQNEKGID